MGKPLRQADLSFADTAPLRIEATRHIDAPPGAIWPAVADAETWTEWFPDLRVARYTTPPPYGVGTGRHVEVGPLKVEEVLLAFDPEERYAFCVTEINLPGVATLVERVTLSPRETGTDVTYVQALALKPWMKPMLPVLRKQLAKALKDGLAGLDRWVTAHADT